MDEEIPKLLRQYTEIVSKLKEVGLTRSSKVVCDYGERTAERKLGLTLVRNSVNKGYDAVDNEGKKYEIKTRKASAWNKPTVFPAKKEQLERTDYVVYVEFDNDWNLVKLLKIPANEVRFNAHNRVVVNKELVQKYSIMGKY